MILFVVKKNDIDLKYQLKSCYKNTYAYFFKEDFFLISFQSALNEALAFEFGLNSARGFRYMPIFSTSARKGITEVQRLGIFPVSSFIMF